ncbi:MAG: pentapeptide repeat-containing protein [Giesbergeria sp.]
MIIITRDELVSLGACSPGLTWFDTHAPSGRVEFPDRTALMVWASQREGGMYVRWLLTTADKSHRGVDLTDARLAYAYLSGADLSGASLTGADLSGANLAGAVLPCAYLTRANLKGARLAYAYLSGADLSGASLAGADLSGASLTGADLSGASLTGAHLDGAYLEGAVRLPTDPPIDGWETYTDVEGVHRLKRTT